MVVGLVPVKLSERFAILGWNTGLGRKPLLRRGGTTAIVITLLFAACGTGATTVDTFDDSTTAVSRSDVAITSTEETVETTTAPATSSTTNTTPVSSSPEPTDEQQPGGEGQVQVIVDLAVDWRPEAELGSDEEVAEQRAAIRATQDAVVEMLTDTQFEIVALYEATPQMALRVDTPALELLRASDLVSQVTEDVPAAPTG
jgi:hypothetical protein